MNLGFSGRLTQATIRSPLTPLFLLSALAVGLVALLTIPREEEPQISVPMVDILVQANGLKAADAVELVTKPLEAIVKPITGVEHVYSQTQDDQVMVTVRFDVGTNEDDAVLRVNDKIRANLDKIPIGIPEPLIVGHGINDVAMVVLTLSPEPTAADRWTDKDLYDLAGKLRSELIKVDNIGTSYIVGSGPEEIRVEPDPEKLSLFGVTLQHLIGKVRDANREFVAGSVRDAGQMRTIAAGQTLRGVPDIGLLLLTTRDGRPVYIRDVAQVVIGPSTAEQRVWNLTPTDKGWARAPAVSLALAKRGGSNAVVVSQAVLDRLQTLKRTLIPSDIRVEVTRDYGRTANDKANELLFHLGLATVSIVVLIALAVGWREAVVTLVVIPTTILLTLFAARLMGYTINRVSLFALIFAIGILVDDAIVVVENIARHWTMRDGRLRVQAAIEAVAEVGNPTIVATLTVIAALLPMLFVSGMMGPYMAPIPANASAAMLFSFFVAMIVAPWLLCKLTPGIAPVHDEDTNGEGRLGRLYRRVATPVLATKARAWTFLLTVGVATIAACTLFYVESVTVKLLPFDNKSELSVVLNMPEGSSLEDTERVLFAAADIARGLPEIRSVQVYAGTAAPFNFDGLVRHYYMRQSPDRGDLQINLADKADRSRSSHAIALDLRQRLGALKLPDNATIQVVEVPPGPPVLATQLAEVYGPDAKTRQAVAEEVKALFKSVPFIVDVTDSYGRPRPRLRISINQDELEYFGVEQSDVYDTIRSLFGGLPVGYSYRGAERDPVEIRIGVPKRDLSWDQRLASTPVPANTLPGNKTVVELGQVVRADREVGSPLLFRRDGHFADMIMAELAGAYEAPIYGMLAVDKAIEAHDWGNLPRPTISLRGQPMDESRPTLLWDGEWEITYVTFRDMGAAFMVAMLGIYVLVVAQFRSFKLPLVILTPIPLTLVGIVPGHWLFGAPFTATSMIGFIALAGIIVRNSILLVDFVRHGARPGMTLHAVLLEAGAIRFKPILLTALAAMIGAATILTDPIFQGLAISLLFGLASSTLLTVLVIPAIYVVLRGTETPL
ncbi:efflux RND transporter permease subunit [Rhodopila sp.]|jgi:multidrug efflux pump subunit AcrB|uniref:efflux RND transporter permease subunit n=1 Tax=Rhodopila sp. TaxID=2480087 RepID=UPI002B6FC663|nr:efflux RND transporter permease subunit [Rhodopila sp.]HVZ10537.1 efflux RND transporter permease subunit [Rhodopila sp.]